MVTPRCTLLLLAASVLIGYVVSQEEAERLPDELVIDPLKDHTYFEEVGDPLFLSNFIEAGRVLDAREASIVRINETQYPDLKLLNNGGRETYSGYITINKACDSNLFFWFVPAKVSR
jgi:hypothetical protein